MSTRSMNTQRIRFLIPCVAFVIVYVAFFAIPQSAETARVTAEVRRKTLENEQLSSRLKSQLQIMTCHDDVAADLGSAPTIQTSLDSNRTHQSRVQVFARVHSVLVSHGIERISAKPDTPVDPGDGADKAMHRVSFSGSFQTVLTALESINDCMPQAAVVALTMNRAASSELCEWELGFRFAEAIR